jgi:hypothetical protein
MMDVQQVIALALVAAAAVLLLRRYAGGRRKPKFKECADCVAASVHAPAIEAPAKQAAYPGNRPGGPSGGDSAGKS